MRQSRSTRQERRPASGLQSGETGIPQAERILAADPLTKWAEAQEWVSVEERLPEKRVKVLIWCPYWSSDIATGYMRNGEWESEVILSSFGESVTHWRPLPAPPKPASDAGGEK